jgi:uncharacterized phiE125 gp8 family phage protein
MTLKLITAPATEPVTLAEAKVHCRCGDDEDALLGVLIQAAREQAEHQLGRALITQTWERVIDAFPLVEVELGMPPVVSVVSVKYIDEAGVEQTMDAADYSLDTDTQPGWVLPAVDTEWPDTLDTANAVRVRFTCGYGAAAAVPAAIKSWMLLRIGTLYKMREEVVVGVSVADIPGGYVDRLLDPYRTWGV